MPLSILAIKQAIKEAKAATKSRKHTDEKGLYLLINPGEEGSSLWRFRYEFAGKENTLTFGAWPEVTLAEARERRDEARKVIRSGRDPSEERKAAKRKQELEDETAFKNVALEFITKRMAHLSARHRQNAISRLEHNIFPALGSRPIGKIEPRDLLKELRKIEARGAHEMANRIRALCSQVFRYGIASGVCERDAAADLRGALTQPVHKHFPSIPIEELPGLLHAIDTSEDAPACRDRQTRIGLQLLSLTLVRTVELRKGLWSQINWEEKTWFHMAVVMKKRRPHIVPLAPQTIELLRELQEITGTSKFLFPGEGKKGIMSENTLNYALWDLGYKDRHCGHGFRTVGSTVLNEAGFNSDWVELQLSHVEKNKSRRAYNHAQWLDERSEMMRWYADYLDELRKGQFVKPNAFRAALKEAA